MTSSTLLPWHSETRNDSTIIYDANKKVVATVTDPRDAEEIVSQMNGMARCGTSRPNAS
jgi:hypothetical protein